RPVLLVPAAVAEAAALLIQPAVGGADGGMFITPQRRYTAYSIPRNGGGTPVHPQPPRNTIFGVTAMVWPRKAAEKLRDEAEQAAEVVRQGEVVPNPAHAVSCVVQEKVSSLPVSHRAVASSHSGAAGSEVFRVLVVDDLPDTVNSLLVLLDYHLFE